MPHLEVVTSGIHIVDVTWEIEKPLNTVYVLFRSWKTVASPLYDTRYRLLRTLQEIACLRTASRSEHTYCRDCIAACPEHYEGIMTCQCYTLPHASYQVCYTVQQAFRVHYWCDIWSPRATLKFLKRLLSSCNPPIDSKSDSVETTL